MRKQIITPAHLDRLPVLHVVYVLQNLKTVAIQVNNETIGAMSIEFGVEIMTAHPNHKWLPAMLERQNSKGERGFIERALNMGEWLVVLEDEVHVFPNDDIFWSTFAQDRPEQHSQEQFIGLVTKAELVDDALQLEGKLHKNPGQTSGFMDLGAGFTNKPDTLPDVPQVS